MEGGREEALLHKLYSLMILFEDCGGMLIKAI